MIASYRRFAFAVALISWGTVFAAPLELYVSPNGNNAWGGRVPAANPARTDGPVATLERAQELVRAARNQGARQGVIVWVQSGTYYLSRTLTLTDAESGVESAPTVFRAYRDEKPVLSGARPISAFKPFRGQIMQADLAAQGLGGRQFRQLFYRGQRQTLARYPNADPARPVSGGWAYVDGAPISKYANLPNDSKRALRIRAVDLRDWETVEGAEVFIFPRFNWWNNVLPVKTLNQKSRAITLGADASYAIRPGDRYFVQNLLAELDSPGEWYLDRKTSVLYFWPPGQPDDTSVSVPLLETVIEISGAQHVQIRGFRIEASDGPAVMVRNSTECLIAGNSITNVGGRAERTLYAVVVAGGTRNGVVGNDISQVGGGGILLSGGERRTLTSAGHYAENNHIYQTGVYYKQGTGIVVDGVGNRASRNLLHDMPRMAIALGGNNHVIEFNHIHHVNLETEDSGAIYAGGRDWLSPRGTLIRHNLIEDSLGFGFENGRWRTPHFAFGIYLDDNASGVDVFGNIVARSAWANIYLHNARDNLIENNLLIDGRDQQIRLMSFREPNTFLADMSRNYREYSTLPAWQAFRGFAGIAPEAATPMANNTFVRNVVSYGGRSAQYVWHRGLPVSETRFESNVVFSRDGPIAIDPSVLLAPAQWNEWQAMGFDRDSVRADPKVVTGPGVAPQLSAHSPAFGMGFKPIPTEMIGPYPSELRVSWPIVEPLVVRENLQ